MLLTLPELDFVHAMRRASVPRLVYMVMERGSGQWHIEEAWLVTWEGGVFSRMERGVVSGMYSVMDMGSG